MLDDPTCAPARPRLSRRLRFEILRRDNYTCRYCGQAAPDVKLTIDHVVPQALGGSDDPANLVTACTDCNAGKSSIAPDSPIVDDVAADALRWSCAIDYAAAIQATRLADRRAYVAEFDEKWTGWKYKDGSCVTRPSGWHTTIGRHFDLGLRIDILTDLVDDVLPRDVPDERLWVYFCGALRNVMNERQDIAAGLIEQGLYG